MSSIETAHLQHTLKSSIHCSGVGLHSGSRVTLTLLPAPADHGIVFRRLDRPDVEATVVARWDNVVDTRLCTVIGNDHGVTIGTIEHLMAALRGCHVDNAIVEITGPEVPIMDGSSEPFVFLIDCAGIVAQDMPRRAIEVLRPVAVEQGDKLARLSPGTGASFTVDIDFETTVIGHQSRGLTLVNGAFKDELSRARTFGFLHEVEMMRSMGLARGGSLDNAIVIDGDVIQNRDGLRYRDEFVRHKLLDAVGDLFLAGGPIEGHFTGVKSGHGINNALLRALFADQSAWRRIDQAPSSPAPVLERATA